MHWPAARPLTPRKPHRNPTETGAPHPRTPAVTVPALLQRPAEELGQKKNTGLPGDVVENGSVLKI